MKKLFLLTLLTVFGLSSNAQTVTFALLTPPCDSNGVVVATVTGITPPIDFQWHFSHHGTLYNSMWTFHYGVTGLSDTLYGYQGGPLSFWAGSPPTGGEVYGSITYSPPFTMVDSATNGICPGLGSLGATVTGGTGPFTYEWINTATSSMSLTNPASVPAGIYLVRVRDLSTGCVQGFYDSLVVSINAPFRDSVVTTTAVCPAMGSASVYNIGTGTSPYTDVWTIGSTGVFAAAGSSVSLPGGYYFVTSTDASGCSATTELIVPYIADFTATVTPTSANCINGTASTSVAGGSGPFSYLWSNGATTASISGLVAGAYSVGITDATGCVVDTTVVVTQTTNIIVDYTGTNATCINADGSLIAFGSGGATPYTYLWSTGATTASITGLTAGAYTVMATDANGCLGLRTGYVGSTSPVYVTYSSTPSACTSPTGTASLSISGGTAPYSITWYTTPVQTGTTAVALSPGNYYFVVTDAAGCTRSGTVTVSPVDVISLSFSSSPAHCMSPDGMVSVSASGGVPPYTYLWSTGGATAGLTGLTFGSYTATVTDAHGCSVTNCQIVPKNSPLILGLSTTPASCLYVSDGTITATAAMGTPPYVFSTGGTSSGAYTAPGLRTGPYWVTVTDAMGCTAEEYTYVNYNVSDSSCFCVVKGTVYNDANHNCVQDAGEAGINHIQMHCSGLGYTYTNDSGNYYFLVPSGTYTVSQTVLGMYPLSPCQPNNIPVTSVAAAGCYQVINFADTLTPIHDMHICTWNCQPPRPGFTYIQTVIITNDGTVTEPNILAGYKPDGQILGPTFVPSGIFTGAPYYYNTASSSFSLAPGSGQHFLVKYTVPADIPLGTDVSFSDTVAYASPITNWLSDYSPWNNVNYFTTTTVGSFDPNFKEVSPKGWGPAGVITTSDSVLEYMVHFQNTGSYLAEKVVVKDTLDPNLDWTSLRPVYASNKCVVDINEHGVATFTFDHINLPPSSSEPVASNAMFTYTIKQRPALPIGTHILNSASIYFDYNAPIKTKSTYNTIAWGVGFQNTAAPVSGNDAFTVYPNPANNTFNATINSNEAGSYSLKISDVAGKTEISKTLSLTKGSQTITVDVNQLASGVYFVTLAGNDGKVSTQKLIIIK